MGRLNKSITIRRRGARWVVDYYDTTMTRHRPSFATKREAENYRDRLLVYLASGAAGPLDPRPAINALTIGVAEIPVTTIAEAIRKYDEIIGPTHKSMTRKNERGYFEALYNYLFDVKSRAYLHEIRILDLEEYRSYLRTGEGLQAASINRRFVAYKAFFAKCVHWGILKRSPTDGIQKLQESPNPRKTWEPEHVEFAEGVLRSKMHLVPYADFLRFLADTGCRPGELCQTNWLDWKRDSKTLRVWSSKGRVRERYAPLTERCEEILVRIFNRSRKEFRSRDGDAIFVNHRKNRMRPAVFAEVLRKEMAPYVANGQFPEGLQPYGLRHSLGTDLERAGISLRRIAELLGHSRTTTTERYTRIQEDQLRSAVDTVTLFRTTTRGSGEDSQVSSN